MTADIHVTIKSDLLRFFRVVPEHNLRHLAMDQVYCSNPYMSMFAIWLLRVFAPSCLINLSQTGKSPSHREQLQSPNPVLPSKENHIPMSDQQAAISALLEENRTFPPS